MLIDGRIRDAGFQRQTGYVQQQDLHLSTSTVREALVFSATLRQLSSTPHSEKIAYVEEVINALGMETYADAIIGVPGEGGNCQNSDGCRNAHYSRAECRTAEAINHRRGTGCQASSAPVP